MIRYALTCETGHPFEAWFSVSSDFDDQLASGQLACPLCASPKVRKQIMAPAVAKRRTPEAPRAQAMMMETMGRIRAHVAETCDYVGDRFATEARQIHEGAAEARGIYGEASTGDVKALLKDGVPVAALPPPAPRKSEVN